MGQAGLWLLRPSLSEDLYRQQKAGNVELTVQLVLKCYFSQFHEGMLTNVELSAVLLYEETFGQTERSQGTGVLPPTTPSPPQPSWEGGGEPSRIYPGRVTSTTAPAEKGRRRTPRARNKTRKALFPAPGTDAHTARKGLGLLLSQGGASGSWVWLSHDAVSEEGGGWVLQNESSRRAEAEEVGGSYSGLRTRRLDWIQSRAPLLAGERPQVLV